ncbi:MAG: asparagine synthetase A [Nitrososphaeria archaeon]|nr:asparagine synthetase A [Nitrososphaeria archaeon]
MQKEKIRLESGEIDLPKPLEQLSKNEIERKMYIAKVMTKTLSYLTQSFIENGFEWLLPVVFSKSTDPLWPDPGASIEKRIETEVYGETVRTTLSMIVHKIVASSLVMPKLFILSPNVRIEKRDRRFTGWHLYEFTQLDFEIRGANSSNVMSFVDSIIKGLIFYLKKNAKEELEYLNVYNSLSVPELPLKVYDRIWLEEKYGRDWEPFFKDDINEPAWVTNIPREFYDYEDFSTGRWDNYDLIVPKYGEILSGARREWEYDKLVRKMERDGVRKENYLLLLKLAREGKIKPSAGAGIGVERLVCWITGSKHVGEVQLFPKIPGTIYDL